MIKALSDLSTAPQTQVIITTHSANVVKSLQLSDIRIVRMAEGRKTVDRALPNLLPTITLNVVNYLAFDEISEEYHDELFGYIEGEKLMDKFEQGKPTVQYKHLRHNKIVNETITMTRYIRHQIHHPENTMNPRYSPKQLGMSIRLMRNFIQSHLNDNSANHIV